MNPEEATLILQCRRPRGQDDHEPAISEALALISSDTAAMERVRCEEGLDALIGERLRRVEPPPDLRRKILVGAKVSRPRPLWQRVRTWFAGDIDIAGGPPPQISQSPTADLPAAK